MKQRIRVVFFGTPEFAVPSLEALASSAWADIAAVITQPDRPAGRGHTLQATPVKQRAAALNLPVATPPTLRNDESTAALLKDADAAVVVAYGKLIPADLLALPARGFVNIHPSLLPRYRGATPIPAAILQGDNETGVTLMQLDEGLDTGPIITQQRLPLTGVETTPRLTARLSQIAAQLLVTELPPFCQGQRKAVAQSAIGVSVTKPLTRTDGRIDWQQSARQIERRTRALEPWPGTWTNHQSAIIKLLAGTVLDETGRPGHVAVDPPLRVYCGQGCLRIDRLQWPGRKPVSGAEAIRGHRLLGGQFES